MAVQEVWRERRSLRFKLDRPWLFPSLVATMLGLFLAAPWSLEHKAHMALHGLCAQRPSHSFMMGDRVLPFDGRMTGIYGGFLITSLLLLSWGRYRAFRLPSWPAMALLGAFVAVMGVDGFNSFLLDIQVWHPYQPHNLLRLVTGLLTGITLAVAICLLLSTTLWRSGRAKQPVVAGVREVGFLVAAQVPFALAVLSGAAWLYTPISLLLLIAATAAVTSLMLVVIVLARRTDGTFTSAAQLHGPATVAMLIAIVVMATIAGGRFWLERITDTAPLV